MINNKNQDIIVKKIFYSYYFIKFYKIKIIFKFY